MGVLRLVSVSTGDVYTIPITNTTPPAGLFTRTDYTVTMPDGDTKDFHCWGQVQFPTGDYSGYATGFTNVLMNSIPVGWYWIGSENSGIQLYFCATSTQLSCGPLKVLGTTYGTGATQGGSPQPDRIYGIGQKLTANYGTAYFLYYADSADGNISQIFPINYAFTFDDISALINTDPYGDPDGIAGEGSQAGGGNTGTPPGFPTGTKVTKPTDKTARAGIGANIYACGATAIKAFTNMLWGSTDSGFISSFFQRVTNTVYNPIDSVITCHSLPSGLSPTGGAATGIVAGGVDFSQYNAACKGGLVSSEWKNWNSDPYELNESWQNYLDYTDTNVAIYLPFCGVVPLDPSVLMNGTIQVEYWCNVLNGNCAAWIWATDRWGDGKLIKVATGNCAEPCPISGNDRGMQQKLGAAVGFAQGMMSMASQYVRSGGDIASAPNGFDIAGRAFGAEMQAFLAPHHTEVVGSLGGSVGFAACTSVFLIIDLPFPVSTPNYTAIRGRMSEYSATVSRFNGLYCELDLHADSVAGATDFEKREIERLCSQGVIV